MADIAQLTAMIAPQAEALGFDLVRVRLFGKGDDRTLQIMAERPDTRQLTIDDCGELSRRVSDLFDALEAEGRDPIEDAYRLEVSSPGIDRPLTRLKDFADWAGHEARIVLTAPIEGRKQFKGILAGIQEPDAVIAIDLADEKRGFVPFDQIADAKLVLTNALIAATRPLSMDGADVEEIDDDTDDNEALESADTQEGLN